MQKNAKNELRMRQMPHAELVQQLRGIAVVLFCGGAIFGIFLAGPLQMIVFQNPSTVVISALAAGLVIGIILCALIFKQLSDQLLTRLERIGGHQ